MDEARLDGGRRHGWQGGRSRTRTVVLVMWRPTDARYRGGPAWNVPVTPHRGRLSMSAGLAASAGAIWALRIATQSRVMWRACRLWEHASTFAGNPSHRVSGLRLSGLLHPCCPLHLPPSAKMRLASLLACIALPLLTAAQSVCTFHGL